MPHPPPPPPPPSSSIGAIIINKANLSSSTNNTTNNTSNNKSINGARRRRLSSLKFVNNKQISHNSRAISLCDDYTINPDVVNSVIIDKELSDDEINSHNHAQTKVNNSVGGGVGDATVGGVIIGVGQSKILDVSGKEIIDDYITPEMNYKETNMPKSPPKITVREINSLNDRDDISLYGTPREEMAPVFGEVKPSFMRHQIEALFQPSDNKLAMKLFGSKKALMKERLRQKESGHWIIHPCSNFR